jgi:hypothetical protein
MNNIKYKVPIKNTVREELEYWNIIYILRKLNIYYREHLRHKVKDLQGLEATDFSMQVLEKIVNESRSWYNSPRMCFLDFVYDIAWDELTHFIRDNKHGKFISYDLLTDKCDRNQEVLMDHFNGF